MKTILMRAAQWALDESKEKRKYRMDFLLAAVRALRSPAVRTKGRGRWSGGGGDSGASSRSCERERGPRPPSGALAARGVCHSYPAPRTGR